MRLIDADALPRHGQRGGLVHWKDIENAPTIDAVEVVRCKECKHWDNEDDAQRCSYTHNGLHWAKPDGLLQLRREENR